jgi:hypothetical protein
MKKKKKKKKNLSWIWARIVSDCFRTVLCFFDSTTAEEDPCDDDCGLKSRIAQPDAMP